MEFLIHIMAVAAHRNRSCFDGTHSTNKESQIHPKIQSGAGVVSGVAALVTTALRACSDEGNELLNADPAVQAGAQSLRMYMERCAWLHCMRANPSK